MRRGRGLLLIAACAVAVTCGFATSARADSGGDGSPSAICQDLQDGSLDGSYTQAQLQAFLSDPTVQGYCSVIVPPCVLQVAGGNSSACQPQPQCAAGETLGSNGQCESSASHTQTTPAPAPVPLTPAVAPAAVKGATHTVHPSAPLATATKRGTLPFTGMQLSVVFAAGLALIGAGLALRYGGRATHEKR